MPRRLVLVLAVFVASCGGSEPGARSILLLNPRGTSANDVTAIEAILRERHLGYASASSRRLNAMDAAELKTYRLVIVPGGNFVDMGNSLTARSAAKLREAVRGGVNYLGICAGAFLAGASPYNGLDLTSGVAFHFYGLEDRGIRKAPVIITTAGGGVEVYWEDGPQLAGWGEPVARYPDGTPAVVQGSFGAGWVVLAGVHPEAPENWRHDLAFARPPGPDHAFAASLIEAALRRAPLPPP